MQGASTFLTIGVEFKNTIKKDSPPEKALSPM
jgi:hypothetical protein